MVLIAISSTAAESDGTTAPAPTVFEMFLKGGVFMYPLALCSVVAITLTLDRLLALRRGRIIQPHLLPGVRAAAADRSADPSVAVLAYCQLHDGPLARVISAGMRRWRHGWTAVEKAMEDASANEALRMRKNMRFLYALGNVATLLGLIGTISGMIKAFQVAAAAGVGRVDQLSRGIYEAMTCTFAGLVVAVVVTVAYYFLIGRIERRVAELNDEMARFADDYGFNAAHAAALPRLPPSASAA